VAEAPAFYSVLIAEEADLRPADIARALAAARQVPFQDMMHSARRCWGIVEERLGKAEAAAAAAALSGAGLRAAAIPGSLVSELPEAEPVLRMQFSSDGLFPETRAGGGRVPWTRLALIAAAGFRQAEAPKPAAGEALEPAKKLLKLGFTLATGLPTSLGLGKPPLAPTAPGAELILFLDLVLRDPERRLRIEGARFDFSGLKKRMLYDVLGNCRQLTADLAAAAPAARRNRGARVFIESRPLREMGYDALSDLERECRWLRTLEALRP